MRDEGAGEAAERLIVALDVPSRAEALEMVERLSGTCRWFKVGMELYYAAGQEVVTELSRRGYRVFLDLKLHDIPTTVAAAVRSVAGSGASLLTIHAGGGLAMMTAAQAAVQEMSEGPRLLGVTVLTSTDAAELHRVGVAGTPQEQVSRLAQLAKEAGLRGVVASSEEVWRLRREFGPEALLVIPGIRPSGAAVGDQKRVATPGEAIRNGASMLVVGRPITRAEDPAAAASAILAEMSRATGEQDDRPHAGLI